jgi:uncharacterized sporulation protein YeaH/YhbH (DUF444 family)
MDGAIQDLMCLGLGLKYVFIVAVDRVEKKYPREQQNSYGQRVADGDSAKQDYRFCSDDIHGIITVLKIFRGSDKSQIANNDEKGTAHLLAGLR